MRCEAIWFQPVHDRTSKYQAGRQCPHDGQQVKLHSRTNRWLCWLHTHAVDNLDRLVPVQFVASKAGVPRRTI